MRYVVLYLIFLCGLCDAQSNQDSLYSIWLDTSLSDSIRVIAFQRYIDEGFRTSKPDSAIVLAKKLVSFGKSNGVLLAEFDGEILLARIYRVKKAYDQSYDHLTSAFENGFNPLTLGCNVIIGDGLRGTDHKEIEIN